MELFTTPFVSGINFTIMVISWVAGALVPILIVMFVASLIGATRVAIKAFNSTKGEGR